MFMGMIRGRIIGAILGYIVGAYIDSLFVGHADRVANDAGTSSSPPPRMSSALQEAYVELGVSPSATDAEVQAAYRRLAMLYHPDRVAHLSDEVRNTAEQKLKRLNEARDRILASRGKK